MVLGFFPKPLLDVINPAVDHTMSQVGKTDPQPAVTEGEAHEVNGFEAPTIEYFTVSPILIVLGVAVLGVLVEAFVPRAPSLPRPGRARPASG